MTNQILINPDIVAMSEHRWPMPIFAFDLDSVLCSTEYLESGLEERFGPRSTNTGLPYRTFKLEYAGVSSNQVYKAIKEIIIEESASALPTPYMNDVIKFYHELSGDPIVVVTARNSKCLDVTYEWLTDNLGDIPWYCAICHGVPKAPVLTALDCAYFVDDRYKTISGLHEHITHPIIYQYEWNQGRPMEASPIMIRDLRDLIPLFNIECGFPPVRWPANIPYPDRVQGKTIGRKVYA